MNFELKLPILAIDFEGQKKAEKLFQIIVSVFAFIAFFWGFYVQKFSHTLLVLGFGIGVCSLLILPPWPFWKKNPIKWQKVQEVKSTEQQTELKDKKKK